MQTFDRLRIRDLLVRGHVGVTAAERDRLQDIVISVTLHADLSKAARSDRLRDSIDYKALKLKILKLVDMRSFKLIERLAAEVADLALADRRVVQVDVTVQKPGALRFARCSEVEITRGRRTESAGARDEGREAAGGRTRR
jgi:D-erythro-7,8-dihydroneopterin triphosphate epimerase